MSENNAIIDKIGIHTVKKFELVEKYVETWAQKLLNNSCCERLVFIDCMCNSGEYVGSDGKLIFGTPVRVAKILRNDAGQYPNKEIELYFNDLSKEKTEHLKSLIPTQKDNFHIYVSNEDGNEMLKSMGEEISREHNTHFLLFYDPYEAYIDWNAIIPFLNNWGEVIINHMVSDSIRAVKMVKTPEAISKYKETYLAKNIQDLIPYGSDRTAYEKRVEDIIRRLHYRRDRQFYIAAFPFFNSKNAIVYNLIHCTTNIAGFRLYKETAWKTFGGKSSTKNTHGEEKMLKLDLDDTGKDVITPMDESCYYVKDIVDYLQKIFRGKQNVHLTELWNVLDAHPIFPSDGFKNQIKDGLKKTYSDKESRGVMSFTNRG